MSSLNSGVENIPLLKSLKTPSKKEYLTCLSTTNVRINIPMEDIAKKLLEKASEIRDTLSKEADIDIGAEEKTLDSLLKIPLQDLNFSNVQVKVAKSELKKIFAKATHMMYTYPRDLKNKLIGFPCSSYNKSMEPKKDDNERIFRFSASTIIDMQLPRKDLKRLFRKTLQLRNFRLKNSKGSIKAYLYDSEDSSDEEEMEEPSMIIPFKNLTSVNLKIRVPNADVHRLFATAIDIRCTNPIESKNLSTAFLYDSEDSSMPSFPPSSTSSQQIQEENPYLYSFSKKYLRNLKKRQVMKTMFGNVQIKRKHTDDDDEHTIDNLCKKPTWFGDRTTAADIVYTNPLFNNTKSSSEKENEKKEKNEKTSNDVNNIIDLVENNSSTADIMEIVTTESHNSENSGEAMSSDDEIYQSLFSDF